MHFFSIDIKKNNACHPQNEWCGGNAVAYMQVLLNSVRILTYVIIDKNTLAVFLLCLHPQIEVTEPSKSILLHLLLSPAPPKDYICKACHLVY